MASWAVTVWAEFDGELLVALQAEPSVPGRTAQIRSGWISSREGSVELSVTPTPGADERPGEEMFEELEEAATAARRGFIGLAPGNGRAKMLGIARSHGMGGARVAVLDHDADGHVAISNIVVSPGFGDGSASSNWARVPGGNPKYHGPGRGRRGYP